MSYYYYYKVYSSLILIILIVINTTLTLGADCPDKLIKRSEWGARNPLDVKKLNNTPPFLVVHHSAGPSCTNTTICKKIVKSIQDYQMNTKEWDDIGYNFLIGGDGHVYEGRGWGVVGTHVPGFNSRSIGVCLLGNFMNRNASEVELAALKNIINCAQAEGKIIEDYHLMGHRQGSATLCPGNFLFDEIEHWPHFDRNPKGITGKQKTT